MISQKSTLLLGCFLVINEKMLQFLDQFFLLKQEFGNCQPGPTTFPPRFVTFTTFTLYPSQGSNPPISTNYIFCLSRQRKKALVSSRTGKTVAASKTTNSQSKPPKEKVRNDSCKAGV